MNNVIEIAPAAWLLKGRLGDAVITRESCFKSPTREKYRVTIPNLYTECDRFEDAIEQARDYIGAC